jgi:hypothetical protein
MTPSQRKTLITAEVLIWVILTALSYVMVTPASLIMDLLYRPPKGVSFDGLHLGLTYAMFIPVINAALVIIVGQIIVMVIRWRNSDSQQ